MWKSRGPRSQKARLSAIQLTEVRDAIGAGTISTPPAVHPMHGDSSSGSSLKARQTGTCHRVLVTPRLLKHLVALLLQLLAHSRVPGRCVLRAGE